MLLQISKRTLQRYRSIGALPYKTLGKKTYYSEEAVSYTHLRALNDASIISKVFFSIDTISIYQNI